MARNVNSLLRITSNVLKNNITSNICISGTRTLFSAEALGIDKYKKTRDHINQQFLSMGDRFREKMHAYVDDDSKNMIFTEDLKNMLHLVNDDKNDLSLLSKMMVKFNVQNEHMRFGSFIFGPVIMRTYYFLNQPDEAFAAFTNPQLAGLFNQVVSYQILLDLLFNHGKYAEMKQVLESIPKNNPSQTKYPRHAVTLVLAACYKENTPESLQYASNLWKQLKDQGHIPLRRASSFFVGLALNQGKPDIGLEVLYGLKDINYVTVRNLKVAALADLNRLEDIVPTLKMSLASNNSVQVKQTYTKDVMDKVQAAIERANLNETEPIVNLCRQLQQNDHVLMDKTLDDLITSEITAYPRPFAVRRRRQDEPGYSSNDYYQQNQTRVKYNQFQRPGLKDLI